MMLGRRREADAEFERDICDEDLATPLFPSPDMLRLRLGAGVPALLSIELLRLLVLGVFNFFLAAFLGVTRGVVGASSALACPKLSAVLLSESRSLLNSASASRSSSNDARNLYKKNSKHQYME